MIEVSANVPGAGLNSIASDGAHNSAKATASVKIADDDASVAIINNLIQPGAANNPVNSSNDLTVTGIIKENVQLLKQLAQKLEERLRELGDNVDSFRDYGVLERLKEQIGAFNADGVLENLKEGIKALTSSNNGLEKLKEEIEAVLAFEGFLLGVQEEIDGFTKYVESHLEQVPDIERSIKEINENLELGKFTVARMIEEALRAMRGQAHLDPERVLRFLKDAVKVDATESTE